MTTTNATPAVREAFESIMEVFAKVAGGRPGEEHQQVILDALENLEEDSYRLGIEDGEE